MKMNIFFLIIACFSFAFACEKTDKMTDKTIVEGIVLDSINNSPLIDVRISLYKGELFSDYDYPINEFFSDSLGKFYLEFEHDEGFCSYSLQFEKTNYYYGSRIHINKGTKQYLTVKMIKLNK